MVIRGTRLPARSTCRRDSLDMVPPFPASPDADGLGDLGVNTWAIAKRFAKRFDARDQHPQIQNPNRSKRFAEHLGFACAAAVSRLSRPAGLGGRLRRLGHRRNALARGRRPGVPARTGACDRARCGLLRHRARLRRRPQRAARRPRGPRCARLGCRRDEDPAVQRRVACALRDLTGRGVPRLLDRRMHRTGACGTLGSRRSTSSNSTSGPMTGSIAATGRKR